MFFSKVVMKAIEDNFGTIENTQKMYGGLFVQCIPGYQGKAIIRLELDDQNSVFRIQVALRMEDAEFGGYLEELDAILKEYRIRTFRSKSEWIEAMFNYHMSDVLEFQGGLSGKRAA